MHSKITHEGMVELPAEMMLDLNLDPGDEIRFVKTDQGYLVMTVEKEFTTPEQRVQYANYVLKESQNIIDKLTHISLEDDVYSEDEVYLCNVVNEKVFEYQEFLKKVLVADGVTKEEYDRIENFWQEIQDNAYDAANRDDKVSMDEVKLLEALNKIIKDLH